MAAMAVPAMMARLRRVLALELVFPSTTEVLMVRALTAGALTAGALTGEELTAEALTAVALTDGAAEAE